MTINALAAGPAFTFDEMTGEVFTPRTIEGLRSMNDGEHYTVQEGGAIVRYSYRTGGRVETIFESPADFGFSAYELSADERKILLTTAAEPIYRRSFRAAYCLYDRDTRAITALSPGGKQQSAALSPDGTMVAFVRDNNLFYVKLSDRTETQITFDGEMNAVINGIPDWVYEEEFAFARAFEWSPASDRIAFMRFDESRVRQFSMNMFQGQLYPSVYTFKYPKAGEENAVVSVHTYTLADGQTRKMDIGEEADQYIPRIRWTPDGRLAIYRLNRLQNHFELLLTDPVTGRSRVVYDERNDRYVERTDDQTITFLADGERFIVRSEREGFFHLYLYSFEQGLLHPITRGRWEVTQLLGVDEEHDEVYYLSSETSPLRRNLYRIKLSGNERRKKRLTPGEGTYRIDFSKGFRYYISTFSNVSTPPTVTLHTADGKLIRTVEENRELKDRLTELNVPQKEFFTFDTADGTTLYGWMLKPPGFSEQESYPVLMTQYSGPGSQRVADSWSMDWEDALVQQGYLVVCVDPRGTGFRGEAFKKITYRQLGKYETEDQIETARYLAGLPYVDRDRIGIYGWSYGGFMALNCILKGADTFRAAVAVAPVTNWRYYDTIYTEIYNGLPQENPAGYDDNSPLFFADRLQGKLLIAHGTGDDNVHVQNTYEMANALVAAGKDFEMQIYPDKNHAMAPDGRNHLMRRIIEFLSRNL
ncbi:MAG: S9 family peptidase [Rikenellaceae bacterium]|jgi:dipeptidyl-peptidase-4|nr:S9 family peptidase [Rikenellaceae bacterium]